MKKLSVLIALALLVTVGGVYATWTYTSEATDIVDANKEVVVQLADATTTGAAGTFHVDSDLSLLFEQITAANGNTDHKAELVYKVAGVSDPTDDTVVMTVTFTPAGNASQDVKDNAVQAELYFSTSTTMTYPADPVTGAYKDGEAQKNVFLLSNEANTFFEGDPDNPLHTHAVKWTKQGDGTFTATYKLSQVKDMIKLNGTIILDTKEDYDAFKPRLNGNIVVNITDGKVNGASGQG